MLRRLTVTSGSRSFGLVCGIRVEDAITNGVLCGGVGCGTQQGDFTIVNGKITEIEVIGNPARLRELDVSIVD